MKFTPTLEAGKLKKRYKRFLADIEQNNEINTVFCPNTGSMKSCLGENWPVLIQLSTNTKRKYPYTLELIHNGECWICINTHRANDIVEEGLKNSHIPELTQFNKIKREVSFEKKSRFDFLLESNTTKCFLEIKSVTLLEENTYKFPDAITERGHKHIRHLIEVKKKGYEAVLLFLILRNDGTHFEPAAEIDPHYAKLLKQASLAGVKLLAYQTNISDKEISIGSKTEVKLK